MSRQQFIQVLQQEVARVEAAKVSKRKEKVIDGFTNMSGSARAIMGGKEITLFNSNDYLSLRFHPQVMAGEKAASEKFGAGPGAVRFISGSLKIHLDLEAALANFHQREAAMIFSSAFATNLAVLFCLLKGQSKDSLVGDSVAVISDELNHRSIIDGVRLANLSAEQKLIFAHMNAADLKAKIASLQGKVKRVVVVTDGVFSMLGEYQHLKAVREVIDQADAQFEEGVWLVVDDCHGVGVAGETGRGVEEIEGVQADVLVGTLGKAFGADGGYVVASQTVIDYLRESAATYIYSNNISPGTAGAALASVQLLDSADGKALLAQSKQNIQLFKELMAKTKYTLAVDSQHAIQPVLIGDPDKCRALTQGLFEAGYFVTSINYPVVPKGKDELRVQVNAKHTREDLENFVATLEKLYQG